MNKEFSFLPWHARAGRAWVSALREKKLPSGLILSGAKGLGKGRLAEFFASSALCLEPGADRQPCGQCTSCHQYAVGTHPDHFRLTPEEDGKQIVVEQVRAFTENLFMTSQYGGYRIGLVQPAEAMNENAFNSFLKTLEEPPDGVHLILVTNRLHALPPTIQSRCQLMQVPRPSREDGLAWLREQDPGFDASLLDQAGGAPLKALELHRKDHKARMEEWAKGMSSLLNDRVSPVELAETWYRHGLEDLLDWLLRWLMDAYRTKLGVSSGGLANPGYGEQLVSVGRKLSWKQLRNLHDQTVQAIRVLNTNASRQLLLESLLISWTAKTMGG